VDANTDITARIALEAQREAARDALVAESFIRTELSCASSGSMLAPVERTDAQRHAAAVATVQRMDAWAATDEGRGKTALVEIGADLIKLAALHMQAQAAADRGFGSNAGSLYAAADEIARLAKSLKVNADALWCAAHDAEMKREEAGL
jgi:hypothetical protein